MRLAVFCDYAYRVHDGRVTAEVPFALFVMGLAPYVDELVMVGRLDPTPGEFAHELRGVRFVPLPYYASAADFAEVARALPRAMRAFWRMLGDVDAVWILGPSPAPIAFALQTLMRRRRLVLGVRQLLPELSRHRHPGRRLVNAGAIVLEGCFRLLARFVPVVVVGPEIARRYRGSRAIHMSYISLLSQDDVRGPGELERDYSGPQLRVLSVGRLDPEKNPLLLADVLAELRAGDDRWQLDVCGDGPLAAALAQRLGALGVADAAVLHGYIPIDGGLWDQYDASHLLLHVSHTEGLPQVLLEAFAARLPVVATAVGGVADVVHGAGLLVAPDDAEAAARALQRLIDDPQLRERLVARATDEIRAHTLESECASLAPFLIGSPPADGSSGAGLISASATD
jgi:glycosyltransferase involved in cell wall biosynthesis